MKEVKGWKCWSILHHRGPLVDFLFPTSSAGLEFTAGTALSRGEGTSVGGVRY